MKVKFKTKLNCSRCYGKGYRPLISIFPEVPLAKVKCVSCEGLGIKECYLIRELSEEEIITQHIMDYYN